MGRLPKSATSAAVTPAFEADLCQLTLSLELACPDPSPATPVSDSDNVPNIEQRIESMRRVASAGYPVRAVMMPVIPMEGWPEIYPAFTRHLVEAVPLQRLTIGGICSYKAARWLRIESWGHKILSRGTSIIALPRCFGLS